MRFARLSVLVILAAAFLFGSVPTLTAATGTCYCSIEGTGAKDTAGASDAASCQSLCAGTTRSVGYKWVENASQGPSSLLQCFSKKELCERDMDGDGVSDGTFSTEQPPECLPGWHYCYPNDAKKYTLQVSIPSATGAVTTVTNYGEYVGLLYKYFLGIAVTIAIVFVMIGGIRYVIGASTGEIGKAKGMITKAISGLALLLCAYLILYTVNPELIKLQVPKLPMIRQVQLLTGGEDCQTLKNQGYTIDDTNAKEGNYAKFLCGTVADILKDDNGADVAKGTTCVYTACSAPDPSCGTAVPSDWGAECVQAGTDYRCISCGQVTPRNDCNVTPSVGLCSALEPADTYVGSGSPLTSVPYDQDYICGYSNSPSMVSSNVALTAGAALSFFTAGAAAPGLAAAYGTVVAADATTGTCEAVHINCQQIATCEAYEDVQAINATTDQELKDLFPSVNQNGPTLKSICTEDPCQVGNKTGKVCTYEAGTISDDCVSK